MLKKRKQKIKKGRLKIKGTKKKKNVSHFILQYILNLVYDAHSFSNKKPSLDRLSCFLLGAPCCIAAFETCCTSAKKEGSAYEHTV